MARGGARPNAGRKKGTQNKVTKVRAEVTKQVIAKAAAEGITPLEVMLSAMRAAWAAADVDKAVSVARDAAPYMHPRLTASTVKVHAKRTVSDLDTAELIAAVHAEGDFDGAASSEAGDRESDPLH